jgi:cytochrome c553
MRCFDLESGIRTPGMRVGVRVGRGKGRRALVVAVALLLPAAEPVPESAFTDELARVDRALKENPSHVPSQALQACLHRRNDAVRLYRLGHVERAERRLKYCTQTLKTAALAPARVAAEEVLPSMAEIQARAAREVELALTLTPDTGKGLEIYRTCAKCHTPEGWGLASGLVPQIAGQHRKVVIKQLSDIRAGNRDNVLMVPYSSVESMGGTQAVADVAGYIDTLEMSIGTGKGSGKDLELGARLYAEHCVRCHGKDGEGNDDAFVPRIQSQHYEYLLRQFEWIRDGKRRNANPEMVAQIRGFGARETSAVLDYVSRLEPPEELRAPPGWHNPDFAE